MKVQTSTGIEPAQATQRQFLKYTFFRVDPQWRRLSGEEKSSSKHEFASIVTNFAIHNTLKSYSLIGIRGDSDFMLWTMAARLEQFQELTSHLMSSALGKYLEIPYSYLAMTRKSEYLGGHQHESQEGVSVASSARDSKYLFVYPFIKKREWYFLPHEERTRMMAQHFKIGHNYPSVQIHTGYSFGLDDQEFVLAFETDQPSDFLDLVMDLRSSEASRYTALETPIFTCITTSIDEILSLLG
jgi:chlorite dismutase